MYFYYDEIPMKSAGLSNLIKTERLILSVPREDQNAAMRDYYLRNREHHALCQPRRRDDFYGLESISERIAAGQKNFERGGEIWLVIQLRDGDRATKIIGDLALSQVARGPFQAAYLGYKLDKDHVGMGYMHEALQAILTHAFEEQKLHRIMANYSPANLRSAAVLKKLGFVVEGYARDYLFLNDRWEDHILSSITNSKFDSSSLAKP